ncbi:conserved hypothetical protein [Leishmania major strain Friedlin]|uniref:Uncharacterized protein n=1 Tax=Leishmania major TaxID=5664 RepID=Q4Q4V7_LEIMA|nr:conserved hypothetical protein [Leishmania major strain Friedlin]CAJ08846.1 conserved hypothetical protein [Leishmania major strain Friedlin]|eukprot:XP_001685641.1 conserved hypothetical protein [Leishmania major strain Friedlin]
MASMVRHYSLSNPPPVEGALDGRETVHEAEILEVQALQAERDGECGRGVLLMERALQIRCHLVNRLREKWASAASGTGSSSAAGAHRVSVFANADAMGKEELLLEYQTQCGELYDTAERLVVRCNGLAVEHFKRGAFSEASPLLEYAMQLTEDGAYPLCEVDERRRHLRGVTLNNLGCMERRRGHFSEALQYMKSSMEMTGVESPVAYMNTSAILIQLRLSDEAVRMAERSIELLYQTPEDPSLLAVAHHNLAMALEPVDPARCLEEYALAYRTACSTLGPESETSLCIQRSWRRYEATRVPPATGAFFMGGDGAAASRLRRLVAAAPTRRAYTAPHHLPATVPRTHTGKSGAGSPMDVIELFPHPFLPSASVSSAPTKTPRDVTPIYRPAVVPRRPLAPGPPPGVRATSSSRSREPQSQPRHQQQEQHRQPRRQYGTEKVMRSSPPASRTAVAAPRPPPTNRAKEAAVAAGSGRVAASMTPSPPPSRQRQATAQRRYSPTTQAQESSRQSPPRTGNRQQRLSVQKSTADACQTASGSRKREKSTLHYANDRLTTQASSTALSSSAAQSPGRGPRPPIKESSSSNHSLPMPLPRNLPPLQTAVAAEPPAVAPNSSYSRSLHDAKANASLPSTSASLSLTSDPLTFLQNRLEILLQDEEELEHKYVQATVIQRYYRGHLAHRRVAALRATRASYARLAQLRCHIAARCIQRAFRRHRRHSRYPLAAGQLGRYAAAGGRRGAQHQAATLLQRIARGWLARRHYAQLRKYACESPAAATRIQRWIRALQARRHYAVLLAAKAEQDAVALEHERRQYAATRIQGQWLTHLQRRACQAALRHRMMARAAEDARCRMRAAIIIQSAWRGYQARRLYQDTYSRTFQLRTARLEYQRRRQAAVRLQAFGRMLIARQHATPLLTVARFRAAAEIRTRSHEGQAAIKIQCAYRRHVAHRVFVTKRAARKNQISQDLVQVHTTTVQRAGRGYMARKDVGTKLSVLQAEAERYERRLLALKQKELEAARAVALAVQLSISELRECEGEQRRILARAEQQQWHDMLTQCNALLAATKETEVEQEAMKVISSEALHDFSRIIKAKKQRAHRQEARDAYLDQCAAEDAEAHKEASARVVTDFMRSAAARSTLRSLVKTMSSYNDARAMQEEDDKTPAAATTDGAAPKRPLTAEQIAAERAELDRLEREELLASEAAAAPKRPLTAEQIAAERAELDRLEREELLASEAAAAPKRPLTAEQIAAERAELDRLEREELLASEAAAAPKRPLTAEQIAAERAELDRLEREELLASEAAAAPKRPLTAEQIAAERAELDRLEREELLASEAAAAPKRPLTAEQIAAERAELDRLEREELLASEAAAAPKRPLTAEQIAAERAELDRLEREELLASEAAAAPKRPLTAEQIAAERAELDRLEREELLASEAAAAPKRPLTAEQIAAERAELDRSEREELVCKRDTTSAYEEEGPPAADESFTSADASISASALVDVMLARLKAIWQAEVAAEKQRRHQREELHWAIFEHRQQRIAAAEEGEDLAPYRINRVHLQMPSPAAPKKAHPSPAELSTAMGNRYRHERAAQELAAVQCIERCFIGWGARKHLKALLRVLDEYLSALQDFDRHEGPVLTYARLREVLARYPDLRTRVSQLPVSLSPPERAAIEDGNSSASPAISPTSRKTLQAFSCIIEAKKQRAHRQEARDAYLDQCAAEDAEAHKEASARVVTDFMRSAAARSTLRSLVKTMSSYNDARAMQEEDDKTPAAATTDGAAPKRPLTAEQIAAERAELDRLEREELLASEAAAAPKRPLTAEQIAAERAELDRLEREELLASEAAAAPKRPLTAEQIAAERAELDRLEREELLASEAAAVPKRPLTAEQIAAERAELDRLEREELLASEAAAAPKRPLTAEQIAAERAERDRLEREELLASEAAAAPKRPLTAEQIAAERAELDRSEREERDVDAGEVKASQPLGFEQLLAEGAAVGHLERWEQISFDGGARHHPRRLTEQQVVVERLALDQLDDLEQVAMERGRLGRLSCVEHNVLSAAALLAQRVQEEHCSADSAYTSTSSSVRPFEPRQREGLTSSEAGGRLWVFAKTIRDKKDLRQRQAARDAYLQEMHNENAIDTDEEEKQQEERPPTPSSGAITWRRCSNEVSGDDREMMSQEALHQLYHQERRSFASSLVGGFVDIIKAKKQRAHRQEARDAYLDQCAAEDAEAHKEASARVVTDFMRSAAARSTLCSLVKTMSSYNDARAMQEEDDKTPAAATTDDGSGEGAYATPAESCEHSPLSAALRIQRFFRGVQARRRVRVLQEAHRAYLEEELAVEELLYSAAVAIQCLYRGHLARRQAAMIIVQRDLYLLSLQEEDWLGGDSKRGEGSDASLPAALSFFASSPKSVAGGGAKAAATRPFTPRRSSSSSYTGLREVASTAIVTEVNEADEAALDQLLHRP